MRVGFATTWRDKCGIAVYSGSLVKELEKHATIDLVSLDVENRSHLNQLSEQMNSCDLIHIQHQYPFFGGMALHRNRFRKLLGKLCKPLVVTIHELDLGEADGWPINMYKPWFNHHLFGAREISRLIVHTRQHRDALITLGIEPDMLRVIPEGVPDVPPITISPEEAKAELGLAGRKLVTIFGFVVRRKGYEVAIQALCDLPEDMTLLIAGGPHPEDKTGFFKELTADLPANVVVTGYLPDDRVTTIMAATDLIAAPFTVMSNSGSLLRSIAYGKPIVASDLPATREINERRECLVLARPGEPVDLAARIKDVLTNPQPVIEAVQAYAREFNVARAADETVAVYKELE